VPYALEVLHPRPILAMKAKDEKVNFGAIARHHGGAYKPLHSFGNTYEDLRNWKPSQESGDVGDGGGKSGILKHA